MSPENSRSNGRLESREFAELRNMDELSSDSDILLNSERSQTFGNEDVAEVDADEVPSDTEDVLEGKEPGGVSNSAALLVSTASNDSWDDATATSLGVSPE